MKLLMKKVLFFFISLFLGSIKELLLKTGRIRILRKRNLETAMWTKMKREDKENKKIGLIILSNHPSLFETLFLPILLWPRFTFFPSLTPVSTPDEKNFMKAKLFGFLSGLVRFFMSLVPTIPISRGSKQAGGKSILNIIKELNNGAVLVFFAEGGRTCKEKKPENFIYLENRKIRKFQSGIAGIIKKSENFIILPVWIDGAEKILPYSKILPRMWKRMRFSFGRPLLSKELRNKENFEILKNLESYVLKS